MSDFFYIDQNTKSYVEKTSQANISKGLYNNYQIGNSCFFDSGSSHYMTRLPAMAGNRRTWTWSGWVKRTKISTIQRFFCVRAANNDNDCAELMFDSADQFQIIGWGTVWKATTQLFRDTSAWYHIIVSTDTTKDTANDRHIVYINGIRVGNFSTDVTPSKDTILGTNILSTHYLGTADYGNYSDLYLSEINFIDGQALGPESFGYFDNQRDFVWKPKKYSGFYGTNGFYLNFTDSSNLGRDFSGNNNNWTVFNITSNNRTSDSPTNNFCTFNPLLGNSTLSNGNLNISSSAEQFRYASMALPKTGKWYFEFTVSTLPLSNTGFWIVIPNHGGVFGLPVSGAYRILKGASDISISGSGTPAAGHIMKVAYDADNGRIWFGRDTLWFSNAGNTTSDPNTNTNPSFSGLTPSNEDTFYINQTGGGLSTATGVINFGQRAFSYTPPTGYKSLCSANLPVPLIKKPNFYFDVKIAAGSLIGQIGQYDTFNDVLVWIKDRDNVEQHQLQDSLRGLGGSKVLQSNSTNAEGSYTTPAGKAVAWIWKAGSSNVTNTNGSITSTVRVNSDAGFSIVSYTGNSTAGATVGHGLDAAPNMIIIKSRGAVTSWPVYHSSRGATKWILLNSNIAENTTNQEWNNTAPTSSVFTVGNVSSNSNQSSTYIAYCFAEKEGYSKFGSYTGNGSADGPFIYCGFRPKWLMIKRVDSSDSWVIEDSSRDLFNVNLRFLEANANSAEGSSSGSLRDFLANGFKIRSTNQNVNTGIYIFAAFAETPFKYALAR